MFELITAVYNGSYMVFFIIFNACIAYHFLKKLHDMLALDKRIKKGYIFITGCDTGFGHNAAVEFNKSALFVFAACLTTEAVEKFNEDENFKGMAFVMNVTKKEDVENARKMVEDKVGDEGLWCLINNAGVFTPGPVEWCSVEDMKNTMDVNLWGAVTVTKAMIPLVKEARGRIINTTSMAGRVCPPNLSSYCMSKYAFEAFSDGLRHEMRHWGVTVHIVTPGFHGTNLYGNVVKRWQSLWDSQPSHIKESYGESYLNYILTNGKKNRSKWLADPKYVVRTYLHAALSSRPQLRYVIGMDANTVLMTIATLPTAMADFVVRSLSKANIPQSAKNISK